MPVVSFVAKEREEEEGENEVDATQAAAAVTVVDETAPPAALVEAARARPPSVASVRSILSR